MCIICIICIKPTLSTVLYVLFVLFVLNPTLYTILCIKPTLSIMFYVLNPLSTEYVETPVGFEDWDVKRRNAFLKIQIQVASKRKSIER
jgi:hypothetical protein